MGVSRDEGRYVVTMQLLKSMLKKNSKLHLSYVPKGIDK